MTLRERRRIREGAKGEVGFTSSHPTRLAPSDENFMIGYLLLSEGRLVRLGFGCVAGRTLVGLRRTWKK
jgi:hypothetical protein